MVSAEPLTYGNLAFFCRPVAFGSRVVKSYRGAVTNEQAHDLKRKHTDFIDLLRDIGIRVPETTMYFISKNKKLVVHIEQERFEDADHAGHRISHGTPGQAIETVSAIADDALKFIDSSLLGRIGFHPSIRNYSFKDDKPWYLDTFPPYGCEKETRKMMLRHAPSPVFKVIMTLGYPFLGLYTQEYYEPSEMLGGVVKTAHRLRPEYAESFREVVVRKLTGRTDSWKDSVLEKMASPSKSLRWKYAPLVKRFR